MGHATRGRTTGDGRERLIDAARGLFLRRGAANVGINEVTETAGVARMTLYNNFPSKEALTEAVYKEMAADTLASLERASSNYETEASRIGAIFDFYEARTKKPHYRGCPFIHASLQEAEPRSPIYEIVQQYKRGLRRHIQNSLERTRLRRSELADQIVLLLDGAVIESYLRGVSRPMTAARNAAASLLL
ncbi:TetR/AcrR family transcriptional regulator [Labrys sp. 22185]|uniref:TetR/AcrR family transcriptional regulator n=1 Tax=Labrys sp. 22185 TaxID=3453888 RepID=UPI003F82B3C7